MKRKKYRAEYATTRISESKKDEIFSRISISIAPSSLYQRRWHYVRPVASIAWVAILWVAIFVVGFIADNQPIDLVFQAIPENTTVTRLAVQASPVWRIIKTQWVLWLDKNGQITPIQTINEWKIITLEKDARIVFAINETVKATITWPARFTIETIDSNTVLLNLLEWSYAQVKTIEDLQEDTVEKELIVKTKQLEVSTRTLKSIDLTISENNKNQTIVTNAWDEIIVKNLETQEHIAIMEDSEAIRDLTTMIASIWQTQVSSLAKSPVLAIRYETTQEQEDVLQKVVDETQLKNDSVNEENLIGIDKQELLALVQDSRVQIEETIIEDEKEVIVLTINDWRVLDEDRMAQLQSILISDSLVALTNEYVVTQDKVIQSELLQKIVNTINSALNVFNAWWSTTSSAQNAIGLAQKLLAIFEEEYFIPPTLVSPLYKVVELLK